MMVSVLRAPRPTDFRPNLWPANWKLWREDNFNTPGTVYDPMMWYRLNHDSAKIEYPNIVPVPDGPGIRFIADGFMDGDVPRPRSADIRSGPGWWRWGEHGLFGLNAQAQVYRPPFMITLWERFSPNNLVAGVQGVWMHTPAWPARMNRWGIDVGALGDAPNEACIGIELDGSEAFCQDGLKHTHGMYSYVADWAGESTQPGGSVAAKKYSGTTHGEWYQVSYLVYRDHVGRLAIMSQVQNDRRHVLWDDYVALAAGKPDRVPYHNATFDLMPFCVIMGNWASSGWFGGSWPGGDIGNSRTFDVREFRVYVPPGDPRLSEPFKSNSPVAPADVPAFWEVSAEVVGSVVNVTITDAQPRADWSVSVTEDAPAPSPPATASGNISWAPGTKDHMVTGIDISSLDPTKDVNVSVTHGGRTWSVVVER